MKNLTNHVDSSIFEAIKTATSNPFPVVCWWDNKSLIIRLESAVKRGWAVRRSHTQAEWTEKGVNAFKWHNTPKIQLQSVGWVEAKKAEEVNPGDTLVWNFGSTSKVIKLLKDTKSFLTFQTESNGKLYERKMKKTRLVAFR